MSNRRRRRPGPRHRFDQTVLEDLEDIDVAQLIAELGTPAWLCDQYMAAGHEANQIVRTARLGDMHHIETAGTPRKAARLMYAMLRHTRTYCPHIHYASPIPVLAAIDAGWVGCLACYRTSGPAVIDDDPRCRLCDRPSKVFTAGLVAVGLVLYAFEACPTCHDEMVA